MITELILAALLFFPVITPKECNIERVLLKEHLIYTGFHHYHGGIYTKQLYSKPNSGILSGLTLTKKGDQRPTYYFFDREPFNDTHLAYFKSESGEFHLLSTIADIIYRDPHPELPQCNGITIEYTSFTNTLFPTDVVLQELYNNLTKPKEKGMCWDATKKEFIDCLI